MVGIGMMSTLAEAWQIMNLCLGMDYDEIGDELARWNGSREMVRSVLVKRKVRKLNSPMRLEKYVPHRHRFSNMQAKGFQRQTRASICRG